MADKILSISSFKFGLDTRRNEISQKEGTLQTSTNGFINQGGEFEQRKAFDLYANLAIKDDFGQSDQGIWGVEVTSAGIVAFGSANPFGGSTPALQSALPAGTTYVQLVHPVVTEGGSYDRAKHRMTAVINTNFNGNSLAAAQFADGNWFLYYNGTIVGHSRYGRVLSLKNANADLASQLSAELTAMGWTNNSVSGGSVDIKTPQGVTGVTYTPSDNDSGGSIAVTHVDDASTGTPGGSARVQFTIASITAGAQTITITAPDGLGGTVTICNAVAVNTNDPATAAQAIVNAINATITSPQYTATFSNGGVETATPSFIVVGPSGNTAINGAAVTFSGTGTGVIGTSTLSAVASPSTLTKLLITSKTGTVTVVSPTTNVTASGGTSPYTYVWSQVSGDTMSITTSGTHAAFSAVCTVNGAVKTGVFKCVVTDNVSATATTNYVNVSLSAETSA